MFCTRRFGNRGCWEYLLGRITQRWCTLVDTCARECGCPCGPTQTPKTPRQSIHRGCTGTCRYARTYTRTRGPVTSRRKDRSGTNDCRMDAWKRVARCAHRHGTSMMTWAASKPCQRRRMPGRICTTHALLPLRRVRRETQDPESLSREGGNEEQWTAIRPSLGQEGGQLPTAAIAPASKPRLQADVRSNMMPASPHPAGRANLAVWSLVTRSVGPFTHSCHLHHPMHGLSPLMVDWLASSQCKNALQNATLPSLMRRGLMAGREVPGRSCNVWSQQLADGRLIRTFVAAAPTDLESTPCHNIDASTQVFTGCTTRTGEHGHYCCGDTETCRKPCTSKCDVQGFKFVG